MGSGESDAPRTIRSLDGWPYCVISWCKWRVAGDVRCREHGGTPAAEIRTDEWGNTETHVDHLIVTWEPWD